MSARAIATRCCSPPDNSMGGESTHTEGTAVTDGRLQRWDVGEAGHGSIGGDPIYYDVGNKGDPDGIDIFPDGIPRGPHWQMPHPHIVIIKSGKVIYGGP